MCDCSQSTTMTALHRIALGAEAVPDLEVEDARLDGLAGVGDEALASAEGCVDADGATLRSATLGVTSSEADWQPASAITTTITSAARSRRRANGHVSSNPRLMWTCP